MIVVVPRLSVLTVTHKPARLPQGESYLPVTLGAPVTNAGAQVNRGVALEQSACPCDHRRYCELTALSWACDHLDCEWLGLVQYRRFFVHPSLHTLMGRVTEADALSDGELQAMLRGDRVVVPKKRRYVVETLQSHYEHTIRTGKEQIAVTRGVLSEFAPDYLSSWDAVMARTWGYMFNLAIAPYPFMKRYSAWLLPLLSAVEQRVDTADYTPYEIRYVGRIGELLWNVWLDHEKPPLLEVPWALAGERHRVKKIAAFVASWLGDRPYGVDHGAPAGDSDRRPVGLAGWTMGGRRPASRLIGSAYAG